MFYKNFNVHSIIDYYKIKAQYDNTYKEILNNFEKEIKDNGTHYLSDNVLLPLIKKDLKNQKISEELHFYFYLIVANTIKKSWYSGYPAKMKEDMIFMGFEYCNRYWQNFDVNIGSKVYSYFTRLTESAFSAVKEKYNNKEFNKIYFYDKTGIDYHNFQQENFNDESINTELKKSYKILENTFYDRDEISDTLLNSIDIDMDLEEILHIFGSIHYKKKLNKLIKNDETLKIIIEELK